MSETGATTTPASKLASSYSGGAWPLEGMWHSDFSWLKNSFFPNHENHENIMPRKFSATWYGLFLAH